MEDIDVRVVIRKLLKRWPFFLASLFLALLIAFVYIKSTEKSYLIKASVQLKDPSISKKSASNDKFFSGAEMIESNPALDDDIGILSSYSTVEQAVQKIGNYLDLYQYDNTIGKTGKIFSREIYQENINIRLNLDHLQIIENPVHISFIDSTTFLVEIEAKDGYLYSYKNHKTPVSKQKFNFQQKGTVGKLFECPYASFTLELANGFSDQLNNNYFYVAHTLKDLTEFYQSQLKITPIGEKANIVDMYLQGPAPSKLIDFLNTLTSIFIANDLQKRNQLGRSTIEFIDRQLANVKDSLQRVEGNLKNFRNNSQVIDVSTTSQNLTLQLNELQNQMADLTVQNRYYQNMADYLSKNESLDGIIAPSAVKIEDPLLNNLLVELSTLNSERVTVAYNSQNNSSPVLKVLDQKIQNKKKALIENITNLLRSSEFAISETQRRINEVKANLNRLPAQEQNLKNIERKFTINDNIYNYLMQKRAEAGIVISSNVAEKSIIDPARQVGRKPVSPNKMLVIGIAVVAGLLIPVGLISAFDYFQNVIESEEQIKKITQLPVVGTIGHQKKIKNRNLLNNDFYVENEFRYIRHNLNFMKHKLIGVTSGGSGEGKTFCAINLAISFARLGGKTLLIDADLYNATIYKQLKIKNAPGLSDYLIHGKTNIIQSTDMDSLDVITAGDITSDASDLLHQNSFAPFINSLKNKYSHIIIDISPVGIVSDYLVLSSFIDYTLFVVRDGFTPYSHLDILNKMLAEREGQIGILYNDVVTVRKYGSYYKRLVS